MKNLFDKIFRHKKYLQDKRLNIIEKDKRIFKERFEESCDRTNALLPLLILSVAIIINGWFSREI